jgi:predicted RNA-binding protein YlqC (UPF0109 family)
MGAGEEYVMAAEPTEDLHRQDLHREDMRKLVEEIAKVLVEDPGQVSVEAVDEDQATVLELRVGSSDLGRVIGRQGRTAKSIRAILDAAGAKLHKRFALEILE